MLLVGNVVKDFVKITYEYSFKLCCCFDTNYQVQVHVFIIFHCGLSQYQLKLVNLRLAVRPGKL